MGATIALAGNPNSGKTTLFNALTGANQYVGNWPGVTVEKKEGRLRQDPAVTVADLPGIYSLSPYTPEEIIARRYLIEERPDVVVNIVDGSNLERNLYLTTQLMDLSLPVVVAINMLDEMEASGDTLDTAALSKRLGVPVVALSALKGQGVEKLMETALAMIRAPRTPEPVRLGADAEAAIQSAANEIAGVQEAQLRWYAIKLLERDGPVLTSLALREDAQAAVQSARARLEAAADDDTDSALASARYDSIAHLLVGVYTRKTAGAMSRSDRIDRVLTNRWLALPIFAAVMTLLYYVAVTSVGATVTDFTNGLLGDVLPPMAADWLLRLNVAPWMTGLLVDGVLAGVGAVLGFVPQMLVLFFLLAILEGCGYMARVAFMMDRIFRSFGLSGKSFIPMLIGTGCSVPGIMASRTIENERDRRMSIITTSFIPCGAKLPVIAMIGGSLLGGAWWVMPAAYFLGVLAVLASGIILKKTARFSGDASPFVMELPPYRWPTAGFLLRTTWERGAGFVKKAASIVLISSIFVWFITAFGVVDGRLTMLDGMSIDQSLAAAIGGAFSWVFVPLGFGDWQSTVGTVMGLVAKENVVSTFGIIFGFAEVSGDGAEFWLQLRMHYTLWGGITMLVFNLLCAPCFAAVGAIRREMNSLPWTAFALLYQTVFAYAVSLVLYQGGLYLTGGPFTLWTAAAALTLAAGLYLLFRRGTKGRQMTGLATEPAR